jgi:PIN domain nuclease of toxin-antitoxin system
VRYLIDTHVLIWSQDDPGKLPSQVTTLILNPSNDRILSIASCWEVAIKVNLGKLKLSSPYRKWIDAARQSLVLTDLTITLDHLDNLLNLPPSKHKDPFDRILCAQAIGERTPIISHDPNLDAYGVTRIWN